MRKYNHVPEKYVQEAKAIRADYDEESLHFILKVVDSSISAGQELNVLRYLRQVYAHGSSKRGSFKELPEPKTFDETLKCIFEIIETAVTVRREQALAEYLSNMFCGPDIVEFEY